MKRQLSQLQRLFAAFVYIAIIVVLYGFLSGGISDLLDQSESTTVWFFSGILLVIMGMYVTEPYFSSPTDTLSNSISLILLLTGLVDRRELKGYWALLLYAVSMFLLSFIHMIVKDRNEKAKRATFWILKHLGSSKFMFSTVYIVSGFSYFRDNYPILIASMMFWICMVPLGLVERIINAINQLRGILKEREVDSCIGLAIRNSGSNLYTISVPKTNVKKRLISSSKHALYALKVDSDSYCLGVETQRNNLIDSTWISIILLELEKFKISSGELKNIGLKINYAEPLGTAHVLNNKKADTTFINNLNSSTIYTEHANFIGLVLPESNISTIRFSICNDNETRITEGTIVFTRIAGKRVLYQVVNGITKIESNNIDSDYGYICAVARKLGYYNYDNYEIQHVNWTPEVYEPVYLCEVNREADLRVIANEAIGRLPGSDMRIPIKDINSLVTHNSAILGILGVGKSCLTFELIQKIMAAGTKVICLDITNQYASEKGLWGYINPDCIMHDFPEEILEKIKNTSTNTGRDSMPKEWGNVDIYRQCAKQSIDVFFDAADKQVLVINPDNHVVRKAATPFKITALLDASLVEKVYIISEQILKKCMALGQTDSARCCVVYEEAHSLTPEFNSVVVKDDSLHVNGTAKVILQGRKYGLGCIVVTQRTANVTKSILNQCNTIFALRVFDDTGKAFLENYIGKDYSDSLPTLEDRHAIVMGKGIGLKQPVIIQLNDMQYLKQSTPADGLCQNEAITDIVLENQLIGIDDPLK